MHEQRVADERLKRESEYHNRLYLGDFEQDFSKKFPSSSILYTVYDDLESNILKELDETKKVLDYGFGDRDDFLFRNAAKMREGIGINISDLLVEKKIEKKKELGVSNIQFLVMDAMRTDFPDNEFDIIRGSAILHHLDIEQSIREIKRILKQGGKACFEEPLGTNPLLALYRKFTPQYRVPDEHPFTKKDMKLLKRYFPKMNAKFYCFFTVLAAPFHKKKYFKKLTEILFSVDKIFLHKKSPFRWLAWCALISLEK